MNIAIIDDCNDDAQMLQHAIDTYFTGSLVAISIKTYASGEQFVDEAIFDELDVVFIDIFMGEINGIDVAKKIRQVNSTCLIVFVTSSNNFAAQSYEVNAIQYLVKPYTYAQFAQAMVKIDAKIKKVNCFFELKIKNETQRIVLCKIVYVDYCNHYVQIHTDDGIVKSYIVTFAEVAQTLLRYKNFIVCYRNLLVNMDKVSKLDGKYFVMLNGDNLPLNRESAKQIKQQYHQYLFSKIEGEA